MISGSQREITRGQRLWAEANSQAYRFYNTWMSYAIRGSPCIQAWKCCPGIGYHSKRRSKQGTHIMEKDKITGAVNTHAGREPWNEKDLGELEDENLQKYCVEVLTSRSVYPAFPRALAIFI